MTIATKQAGTQATRLTGGSSPAQGVSPDPKQAGKFWKKPLEEHEELSLEELIEKYLDQTEQKDPLFVTKRFMFFEGSLSAALRDEYEGPPPPDEY